MARDHVLDTLERLERHYTGYRLVESVIDDFVRLFETADPEQLEAARRLHVSRSRFFPKVVELRAALEEVARQGEQPAADDPAADFWTAARRELWRRVVEHSLTCEGFDALDHARTVEQALGFGSAHLATCTRPQASRPYLTDRHHRGLS